MRAAPLLILLLVACNPYSPDLGDTPFRCGAEEPRCPSGYECIEHSTSEHICERNGFNEVDAGPDEDAAELVCNDDSDIEPNETIAQAFLTPIPTFRTCTNMVSLAVCPSSDKDLYSFRIEAGAINNLRAAITHDVQRGTLELKVLNSSGATIANGAVIDGNTVQVTVPNMSVGTFYVQVGAPTESTIENNYTLEITTCDTAGCPTPCQE